MLASQKLESLFFLLIVPRIILKIEMCWTFLTRLPIRHLIHCENFSRCTYIGWCIWEETSTISFSINSINQLLEHAAADAGDSKVHIRIQRTFPGLDNFPLCFISKIFISRLPRKNAARYHNSRFQHTQNTSNNAFLLSTLLWGPAKSKVWDISLPGAGLFPIWR